MEHFQDLTEVKVLNNVNVSAAYFIWDKVVASLCYSDKYRYNHLTISIPPEACNSLAEKRVRINILSTQTYFQRTLKKEQLLL